MTPFYVQVIVNGWYVVDQEIMSEAELAVALVAGAFRCIRELARRVPAARSSGEVTEWNPHVLVRTRPVIR